MWLKSLSPLTLAALCAVVSFNPGEAFSEPNESPLSTFLFADTYAATSRDTPPNTERTYFTQASKNGGPHINLAAAGLTYDDRAFRVKLAGQFGDSVNANYAAEPREAWKFLQEGCVGVYLSPKVSVDAGVFFSPIAGENWVSAYNPNYTRSLIAEFSPYYESGGRVHYSMSDDWSASLFVLNGWQNISAAQHPALGTSLSWTDSSLTITSNTFAGNENDGTRLFHDLIAQKKFLSGSLLSATIDVGHQDAPEPGNGWWWGYAITGKTPLTETLALNGRIESYQDPNAVITTPPSDTPFRVYGLSLGTDVDLGTGLYVRGEVKHLMGVDRVFFDCADTSRTDTLFILSLSFLRASLL